MSRPSTFSRRSERGLGERGIADGGAQVGEQVEVLAQPQQAGLGAHLVGHLVPLRPADGAEHDGVGGFGLGQRLAVERHAELVDGGAADEAGLGLELHLALLVEEGDDALHLGHHLGPDAVAGQEQQGMCGHGRPPSASSLARIANLAGAVAQAAPRNAPHQAALVAQPQERQSQSQGEAVEHQEHAERRPGRR